MKVNNHPGCFVFILILLLAMQAFSQIEWTAGNSGTDKNLNAVVYGGGQFVAVGEKGTVITSIDGISWKEQVSGVTVELVDIAYGGGRYVAVGDSGVVIVSSDGITWEYGESGTSTILESIAYGNDIFITIGIWRTFAAISSGNGNDWSTINFGNADDLNAVVFGIDQFLLLFSMDGYDSIATSQTGIAGWDRKQVNFINGFSSPRFLSAYFLNNRFIVSGYEFEFGGQGGVSKYASFAVISEDLVNWETLYQNNWVSGHNYPGLFRLSQRIS